MPHLYSILNSYYPIQLETIYNNSFYKEKFIKNFNEKCIHTSYLNLFEKEEILPLIEKFPQILIYKKINQVKITKSMIEKLLEKSPFYIPLFIDHSNVNYLKKDKQFALECIRKGIEPFIFSSEIYNDSIIFKEALKLNPILISESKNFKSNEKMSLFAIKCLNELNIEQNEELQFKHFDLSLINNSKLFMENAIECKYGFHDIDKFIPNNLLNDRSFILKAIRKNPKIYLKLTSNELKNNLDIVELSLRCSPYLYNQLNEELRKDYELFLIAISRGLRIIKEPFYFKMKNNDQIVSWNSKKNLNFIRLFNVKFYK
jgi:hypothetical protein